MKTLLAIFAHPDDESFGPSAHTLAHYAEQGVAVHLICATRGEAGTVDDQLLPEHAGIAALRTAELAQAAYTMGLAGLHFLNYRDSGMPGSADNDHPDSLFAAPLDQVAAQLADYIRLLKPDAIITHDQFGWYGHPDHIVCHQATLRAYKRLYGLDLTPESGPKVGLKAALNKAGLNNEDAGQSPQGATKVPRLYLSYFAKNVVKLAVRVLPLLGQNPRRFGQNKDVDLVEIASWVAPVTAKIKTGPSRQVVKRASACHASQRPLTQSSNFIADMIWKQEPKAESFYRLYPPVAPEEGVERELFEQSAPQPAKDKMPLIWHLLGLKQKVHA